MLLIISWNINIPRQFNNQWNNIRSIMTYQLSRSHDQVGRKLPPQKLMCGSFRPPIFFEMFHDFNSLLITHRVFPMPKNRLETQNIWRGSKTTHGRKPPPFLYALLKDEILITVGCSVYFDFA
jgi:hypothetical protein